MDMPDIAALKPILAELGLPSLARIQVLAGGSVPVFRLRLETGESLVLKCFASDDTAPEREAYPARLLAGAGIPVTRYLLIDESCTRLPFRFALTTYLDGSAASTFAGHPGYSSIFRQIGTLSRKLHGIEMPGFGELPEPRFASNADYVRQMLEHAIERFVHYGAERSLADKLRQVFERDFDRVVPVTTRAVFAHDDLHPNNVLVVESDGELTISGIIDFGNARASASTMDLAKTIFCCAHDAPGHTDAILAGYGAVDHPSPDAALTFYTVLHRMVMWWWLRHIGVLPSADAPNDIMPALRIAAEAW